MGVTSLGLAMVALDEGDTVRAAELCRTSLQLREDARDLWGVCQCLIVAAAIMQRCGDAAAAARALGAESRARESVGGALSYGLRQLLEQTLPAVRTALGDQEFQTAWDAGRDRFLSPASAEAIALLTAAAEGKIAPPNPPRRSQRRRMG